MNLRRIFLPAVLIPALLSGCITGRNAASTSTLPASPTEIIIAATGFSPADTPTSIAFSPAAPPSETATPFSTAAARSATPEPAGDNPTACLPPGLDRPADGDYAPVAWIIDGASFVIDRSKTPGEGPRQTVRLIGVDAPPIAKTRLEELLKNQIVRLVADPDFPDADSTGRLLRYALTLDGVFVNDLLVRSGAARFDPPAAEIPGSACGAQFAAAEAAAQEARLGLWGVVAVQSAPTQPSITAAPPTPTAPASSTLQASHTAGPSPTGGPSQTPSTVASVAGTPTATASGSGSSDEDIEIINIFVIGTAPNEPDEYIELKNTGAAPFNLTGWSLYSDETFAEVYFPQFSLGAGQTCRVYTNLVRPDSCAGISFESEEEAWTNDAGCGGLYDPDEFPVADFCYPTLE